MSPICLRRSGHYRAMCELRTSRPLQFQLKHRSLAELVVLRDRHANGREDLTNIEKKTSCFKNPIHCAARASQCWPLHSHAWRAEPPTK